MQAFEVRTQWRNRDAYTIFVGVLCLDWLDRGDWSTQPCRVKTPRISVIMIYLHTLYCMWKATCIFSISCCWVLHCAVYTVSMAVTCPLTAKGRLNMPLIQPTFVTRYLHKYMKHCKLQVTKSDLTSSVFLATCCSFSNSLWPGIGCQDDPNSLCNCKRTFSHSEQQLWYFSLALFSNARWDW